MKTSQTPLLRAWKQALAQVSPDCLLASRRAFPRPGEPVLCWGKAALRTWETVSSRSEPGPSLVITTEEALVHSHTLPSGCQWVVGEHPLPGPGSLAAGRAVIDFFDLLRRSGASRLTVYLSGGASSLAWLPKGALPFEKLRQNLQALYRKPLTIQQLNRERSSLCHLKAGGSASWLHRLAPGVRARVFAISDVLPFGPQVIGSGPFWEPSTPHTVLADNSSFVRAFLAGVSNPPHVSPPDLVEFSSGSVEDWEHWVRDLTEKAQGAIQKGQTGLFVRGGEPKVAVPRGAGRGGRQSQIGAALLVSLAPAITAGRIELICASSDGVDGRSGGSGAYLDRERGSRLFRGSADASARVSRSLDELRRSVRNFDTGSALSKFKILMPLAPTGTNVQDLVALRVY